MRGGMKEVRYGMRGGRGDEERRIKGRDGGSEMRGGMG